MRPLAQIRTLRERGGSRRALPEWFRVRLPGNGAFFEVRERARRLGLHTVCEEARCPNIGECWGGGTATFMVLGDICTRACRFCHVKSGNPRGAIDRDEPEHVAEAVAAMGLRYAVLTSVDRDDLADGGAGHFAACVRAIRRRAPGCRVETLIPDFAGDAGALAALCASGPDVIAQNLETVERLTHPVRDRRAGYRLTLDVLAAVKGIRPAAVTKSSLMLGLGEREDEVVAAMRDLRAVGVEILTLGQYLRPSPAHLPVVEFVTPARFDRCRDLGLAEGFRHVASGPLVRSSYRAAEHFIGAMLDGRAAGARVVC